VAGESDEVVIVPRFSALHGEATFLLAPLNVRAYHRLDLALWRNAGTGVDTFEVRPQFSPDLDRWEDVGTEPWSPAAGQESKLTVEVAQEWFRLASDMTGTDPTLMLWVVGRFARRGG
jgi:hypothetical protein